ncbi:hypothetical protein EJ110_NYTH14812 [Nymphaea thermarum]|nr:hypothetical protein EJ110_NYTH14812 [Nymphaea thermarum]
MACVCSPSLHFTGAFPSSQKTTRTSRLNPHCSQSLATVRNEFPTMEEIVSSCKQQNLQMRLQTLGPFFRVTATNIATGNEVGRAEGVIRLWVDGTILHLDSIRLKKETLGMKRSIFGLGLFVGAVAIRHGYDHGCRKAELLAINDSDVFHSKLVRFYSRIGFKAVYDVTGSSMGDVTHMLVWGGRGTRMDADIEELMIKWGAKFKNST